MPNEQASATQDPYLTLRADLVKGVYALSPDAAWEKYRDQLAQLHAATEREDERQRMAWGAYQMLLQQNRANLARSFAQTTSKALPLGAAFSHAKKVARKKGKSGDKKLMHNIAQRYLTANGHGKMGES